MDGPVARTPEELETLLEDAFVLRDRTAVAALFTSSGLLVTSGDGDTGATAGTARGPDAIGRLASRRWRHSYVADARRILQAGDIALIVSVGAVSVARRDNDGRWRYAVAMLDGTSVAPAR